MEQRANGAQLRVIAGQTNLGTRGPIQQGTTEPIYFDVAIAPDSNFVETIPTTHNGFVFVYDGSVTVLADHSEEEQIVKAGTLAVLGEGESVRVSTDDAAGKFLLIAGKPLNEPVAHGGPFVINTTEVL